MQEFLSRDTKITMEFWNDFGSAEKWAQVEHMCAIKSRSNKARAQHVKPMKGTQMLIQFVLFIFFMRMIKWHTLVRSCVFFFGCAAAANIWTLNVAACKFSNEKRKFMRKRNDSNAFGNRIQFTTEWTENQTRSNAHENSKMTINCERMKRRVSEWSGVWASAHVNHHKLPGRGRGSFEYWILQCAQLSYMLHLHRSLADRLVSFVARICEFRVSRAIDVRERSAHGGR